MSRCIQCSTRLDSIEVQAMAQSFGDQLTLVEVTTDNFIPKRQLWVAAAKPDQAVTLVLCAVPVGWTAAIADERLPKRAPVLSPGEVCALKH
jgi:hypothetical protein